MIRVGVIGSTPITSLTRTTTTTKRGNDIATPTSTQSGIVGDCDEFLSLVHSDTCYDIANTAGVMLTTVLSLESSPRFQLRIPPAWGLSLYLVDLARFTNELRTC